MTTATKYMFESSGHYELSTEKPRKHHRRGYSGSSDINGNNDACSVDPSLSYSAASSINSSGESTDSSFADIMRVLDIQDHKKDTTTRSFWKSDERSRADSMAYSTDAESYGESLGTGYESGLHGTGLLNTTTGHPIDQNAGGAGHPLNSGEREGADPWAGGMQKDSDMDIFFSPAEHTDSMKRRKDKKRRERKNEKPSRIKTSGRARASNGTRHESRQGAPTTRPPKAHKVSYEISDEEDIWYSKWWMFCFPDASSMIPKR